MASVETEDLEALFDQIVAEKASAVEAQSMPPVRGGNGAQASAANDASRAVNGSDAEGAGEGDLYHRVGRLTRVLHDTLHELGYDENLAKSVVALPDARDRLAYIANLTGQAAERALSAVETGQAMQQQVAQDAKELSEKWDKLYAKELSVEEFKLLAGKTREFLSDMPKRARDTHQQLHEIMMAQDFHDLTGQVIMKIVALARTMEDQLVSLLIEAADNEKHQDGWLSGPTVNTAGRSDVVANQTQVDELLDSLGF